MPVWYANWYTSPTKHNVLIENATHFILFEKNRFTFFESILKFLRE